MLLDPGSLEMSAAVEREFRCGENARFTMAAVAQEKLNALTAREETRMIDGVGQLVGRIDPDVYWAMRLKHGEECWNDPTFRKLAIRDGLIARPCVKNDRVRVLMGGPCK
jgi:hypothetical protein